MARALIVACGCRGRSLGAGLLEQGWSVRGTTRRPEGAAAIESGGIEPALADPERPGSVLELVGDVTVVYWLLGSAGGEPELLDAIHGDRLRALLEHLVDTPVRGFVYESAGSVGPRLLEQGLTVVEDAARTWRIPVATPAPDPIDHEAWLETMLATSRRLLA